MTRDFASKNKKRSNATRFKENAKESTNSFNTMIMGLVLGIVIALIAVYYYQSTPEEAPQKVVEEIPKKPSGKNRYKAIPAEEVEQSDFSYHEELANKTVEVEVQSLPEAPDNTGKTWIMQCSSFTDGARADKARAEIALAGLESWIRQTKDNAGKTWYRVVLGPYQSKRQAERDRHELQRNRIDGCVIW